MAFAIEANSGSGTTRDARESLSEGARSVEAVRPLPLEDSRPPEA
jgi:hypothetical protein